MANRTYHHGNLRESLIEAGIELINQGGIQHLSLRKTAALCGVSQAAPYTHFNSKEDMLEAMRAYVLELFMGELERAAENPLVNGGAELLVELGKRYVLFFTEHPQYFSFLFSHHCMEINLDFNGDDTNNFPPYRFFKTHAVPVMERMGMTPEKIEDGIIAMWAMVHGLAAIATMRYVHYSKDWSDKIEDILLSR